MIQSITSPEVLLDKLALDKEKYLTAAQKASQLFDLRVTESFVSRMEKGNPQDPLLLQVLPLHAELKKKIGFTSDPLQEQKFNPVTGLLHKYESRVLVNFISQCAIHCRYCFRREFPYQQNNPGKNGWQAIFQYIEKRPVINEVILSGADPLTAPDHLIEEFGEKLLTIKQIKTLRIHTRLPIVLPERVTTQLTNWLKNYPLQKVMVLHTNHPNEINHSVVNAVKLLKEANITLLNHSVMLKNINDDVETLIRLSEKLFSMGVMPYYCNLLDKVNGAAHFEVSEMRAKKIMKSLQERLPGYLVPKLARETPGKKHKTVIL